MARRSWSTYALYAGVTFVIASVPVVLTALSYEDARRREQLADSLGQVIAIEAVAWYAWIAVVPLIDRRVRSARHETTRQRLGYLAGHLALAVGFGLVHGLLIAGAVRAVGSSERAPLGISIARRVVPDLLLYAVISAGFTIAESRRRQTEIAERLRGEIAEARLDALRQQLNPHFLFNTLNHIVMQLRARETDSALRMLLALSDLLRHVLKEPAQLIPLGDELRMIEQYLEIERARFGERLLAHVTFEPRSLEALVPSLVLQPLVENAMRHGVSTTDGTCRVWLSARVRDARLRLEIRDAGPGVDPNLPQPALGIGLRNTMQRLTYLYGGDHELRFLPLEGGGLTVALDLPFRAAGASPRPVKP